ncbi:hypothetical protein BC2230_10890 [Burkholderia cepacia]
MRRHRCVPASQRRARAGAGEPRRARLAGHRDRRRDRRSARARGAGRDRAGRRGRCRDRARPGRRIVDGRREADRGARARAAGAGRHVRCRQGHECAAAARADADDRRHGLRSDGRVDRHGRRSAQDGRRVAAPVRRCRDPRRRTDARPAARGDGRDGHRRDGACDRGLHVRAAEEPGVRHAGRARADAAVAQPARGVRRRPRPSRARGDAGRRDVRGAGVRECAGRRRACAGLSGRRDLPRAARAVECARAAARAAFQRTGRRAAVCGTRGDRRAVGDGQRRSAYARADRRDRPADRRDGHSAHAARGRYRRGRPAEDGVGRDAADAPAREQSARGDGSRRAGDLPAGVVTGRAGAARRPPRIHVTMPAPSGSPEAQLPHCPPGYALDASAPAATTYADACFVPSGCVCR